MWLDCALGLTVRSEWERRGLYQTQMVVSKETTERSGRREQFLYCLSSLPCSKSDNGAASFLCSKSDQSKHCHC